MEAAQRLRLWALGRAVQPSHWHVLGAALSALAGDGLACLFWNGLEHIAVRMGVTVLVLIVLLFSEAPSHRRSRR